MIQKQDLFNIRFYAKEKFHGSFLGMYYRIEKEAAEDEETKLKVTVWPGPYNFDTTNDSLKESALFSFSSEGLEEACAYLNETYTTRFASLNQQN